MPERPVWHLMEWTTQPEQADFPTLALTTERSGTADEALLALLALLALR